MDVTGKIDVYHHIVFGGQNSSLILDAVEKLEKHLMTQDEAVAAFKAAADAQLTALDTALDNIAADEKAILDKLKTLGGLSPANQAILDQAVADLTNRVAKTKALADSIPDTPVVEP